MSAGIKYNQHREKDNLQCVHHLIARSSADNRSGKMQCGTPHHLPHLYIYDIEEKNISEIKRDLNLIKRLVDATMRLPDQT